MSWMKRPQGGAPPEPQRYAAPQALPNQQSMYNNYQGSAPNTAQPQQFWQAPPPQQQPPFNQQYGQTYQNTDYGSNANQYYQQPQPNQYNQYPSQNFGNNGQEGYQQNYYQNVGVQPQNYSQSKGNTDSWDDNWDWGWDDSSKAQKGGAPPAAPPHATQQIPPQPAQPVFNNANVIEESFASTNSWNWSMEDKKDSKDRLPQPVAAQEKEPATLDVGSHLESNLDNEFSTQNSANSPLQPPAEEVKTLNDREVVKERMPNLALGKRLHLDNLTPQWSIESQMSQDSSDGPLTQSEGGPFRSELQSRNSDKSNYSQHSLDDLYSQNPEWMRIPPEEPSSEPSLDKVDNHVDLTNSMNELSIANTQNPDHDTAPLVKEPQMEHVQDQMGALMQLPPSSSPSKNPLNLSSQQLPNLSSPLVPLISAPSSAGAVPPPLPPRSSSPPSSALPPHNFPPPTTSQNPFKHAGGFSHKNTTKVGSSSASSTQSFPPSISNTSLTSPANKGTQQNRVPVSYGANLETTPDNSERPDQPHVPTFRTTPITQQVPENLEVAPKNDRNEYLQTAHLSSGDYGENTDFSGNMPPPGLRRMVLGQQESEYNQGLNISGDEPPPGLARMVPGQQNEENTYNQPDNYLDRQIDGQPTDGIGRTYRRAPLHRMVPGEPSAEFAPYAAPPFAASEQRVVTGLDRDYDVREQDGDGFDYCAQMPRNVTGVDLPADFNTAEERQREVVMEGENLQDLSIISSTELTFSREATLEGADITATDAGTDRKTDASDSLEHPATNSRRQSLNHVNTSGDDSERDRLFKSSPRRDKHRSSRDRDRGRDKEGGRYSRGDRKYDTTERRSGRERDDRWGDNDRDDRWGDKERDESPDARRRRRNARQRRYDTEDTDYCSDRERERRRYREGSYTSSKPPRPDDKDRRYDERERSRRYNTVERERRHDDERGRPRRERHDERRDERRGERHSERRYRDIDPSRKHGNLQRERDEARASSRGTDDDSRARRRDVARRERHARNYYDEYGAGVEAYELQRRQYEYYERLRRSDPAAYMVLYQRLLAAQPQAPPTGFLALGELRAEPRAEQRAEQRASVHSGRSSANDLKGHDTDLNTDASLSLQLEEATLRSERLTPVKFATAHARGGVAGRALLLAPAAYPADGRPAAVLLLRLADLLRQGDPLAQQLHAYPGPLLKGVTHKKSVAEYCSERARDAGAEPTDARGRGLLWELLALLLRQNGVVVGSDIAELLMKNKREFADEAEQSSLDGDARDDELDDEQTVVAPETEALQPGPTTEADMARLRELLLSGNRPQAIEWAMSRSLWGHALQLAAHAGRRERANVLARFAGALAPQDPLRTLYDALQTRAPVAAAAVADARWGDWRPHAAIVLANSHDRPEHASRTLLQLGDSLASRGLPYSAQFCYVSGGAPFARHPLAPFYARAPSVPRLALLLADHKAHSLPLFATNEAIFATEIYEYAMSLNQDFYIEEFQVYKLVLASRLADVGECERALAYSEQAARALLLRPTAAPPMLLRALAQLAERLRFQDAALEGADDDSAEPSPEHRAPLAALAPHTPHWLDEVARHTYELQPEQPPEPPAPQPPEPYAPPPEPYAPQLGWGEQVQQQYMQPAPYPEPAPPEEAPEYSAQYYAPPPEPEPAPAPYWPQDYSYDEAPPEPRPTISMPGARAAPFADDERPPSADAQELPAEAGAAARGERRGWLGLGGLLGKLSLRAPHQMILPDDKNPTIVWDEQSKRWRNTDGDEDAHAPPPPPPKGVPAPAHAAHAPPPLAAPPPTNMFKMQRTRHIKNSYVDVLNPGGARAPLAPPSAPPAAPAYFVPAPPPHQGADEDEPLRSGI